MAQPTPPKYADAYADLGLESNASSSDIRAAYRTLALLHHPDKNLTAPGQANDAAEFRRVNEAYELLKDDDTKARYDRQYSNVHAQWTKYRSELAEYSRNPDAWRTKQASAARVQAEAQARARAAASQRSQTHYYYDDSDVSDWEYEERGSGFFGYGSSFNFGGSRPPRNDYSYEARRAQEYNNFRAFEDWEEWYERRAKEQRAHEARLHAERIERLAKERAVENANKRAIELQKEEAEAQQSQTDGIRTYAPEERLAMAEVWVQGVQRKYAQILREHNVSEYYWKDDFELGWERKKGRQTCHFCDAQVQEYSYRCPSGGAVACRGCKNAMASSTLEEPFAYVNTHAGAKKGKGRKKAKKTKVRSVQESQSDSNEQDGEEDAKCWTEADELAARELEAQLLEKQRLEREAQKKAKQEAAREARERAALEKEHAALEKEHKLAQEKAEAEVAAREKAAKDETARKVGEERKAARAKKLEEEKAEKKAARKMAARERIALEKAKQREAREEEGRPQREAQELEMRERKAQEKEIEEREAQEAREKEVREREAAEAREQELREQELKERELKRQELRKQEAQAAEEQALREAQEAREKQIRDQEAQRAQENAIRLARDAKKRRAKEAADTEAKEKVLRVEQQAREARELSARLEQQAREAREHAARVELQASEAREAVARAERIAREHEERHVTTPSQPTTDQQIPRRSVASGTKLFCIECKGEGHIARRCPNKSAGTTTNGNGATAKVSSPYINDDVTSSADDSIKVRLSPPKFNKPKTQTPSTAFNVSPVPNPENSWTAQEPVVSDKGVKVKLPPRPKTATERPSRKKLICHMCKQEGHMKRNCPMLVEQGNVVED